MENRLPCCVPFCRRTRGLRKGDGGKMPSEWICGDHWRLVPRSLKKRKRLVYRIARRADERFNAAYMAQDCTWTEAQLARVLAAVDLAGRIWERCKAVAIENAAGINSPAAGRRRT